MGEVVNPMSEVCIYKQIKYGGNLTNIEIDYFWGARMRFARSAKYKFG